MSRNRTRVANTVQNLQNQSLRYGFGVFFLVWGVERLVRTDTWASPSTLGAFYGDAGAQALLVQVVAVAQLVIAAALFANVRVKTASTVALAMVGASTAVTFVPLTSYLINGGNPIPSMLFIDHAPLLGGLIAVRLGAGSQSAAAADSDRNEVRIAA